MKKLSIDIDVILERELRRERARRIRRDSYKIPKGGLSRQETRILATRANSGVSIPDRRSSPRGCFSVILDCFR
jgi:hypothetical protein